MVDTDKGKKVPLYQVAQVQSQNDLFIIEVQDTFPNVSITLQRINSDYCVIVVEQLDYIVCLQR